MFYLKNICLQRTVNKYKTLYLAFIMITVMKKKIEIFPNSVLANNIRNNKKNMYFKNNVIIIRENKDSNQAEYKQWKRFLTISDKIMFKNERIFIKCLIMRFFHKQ